jgi:hypothetical protein
MIMIEKDWKNCLNKILKIFFEMNDKFEWNYINKYYN